MTPAARLDLKNSGRLLVLASTAVVVVAIFLAASLPFQDQALASPSPELVMIGALGTALVLPWVRPRLIEWARRLTSGARATPYETLAEVSSRMESTVSVTQLIPQMSDAIARGIGADRVTIRTSPFSRDMEPLLTPSEGEAEPDHRASVRHDGTEVGVIEVFKSRGLTPHEIRLVDDLASSAGIVMTNALSVAELERKAEQIAATHAAIAESRRRIVISEQRHREAIAAEASARVAPLFDQLRSQVRDGSLDDAAGTAELLIETLRSVSTAVLGSVQD